jgi:hypothetical protein
MFVSFDFGRVGYLGPKRLVWSARDQVFKEFPPSPILFFSTNVIRLSLESRNESSIFVQVLEASLRAQDCLRTIAVLQLAWFPLYGSSDRKGIVTCLWRQFVYTL